MCDFDRKVTVQAHDYFESRIDIAKVDAFIRSQRVPGELTISYPGNGGRTSVVFKGKAKVHSGEVEALPEKSA